MIPILNIEYSSLRPQMPNKNAVAVFNSNDAKLAFRHNGIEFVVALNEDTCTFKYCFSIQECEQYYEK